MAGETVRSSVNVSVEVPRVELSLVVCYPDNVNVDVSVGQIAVGVVKS